MTPAQAALAHADDALATYAAEAAAMRRRDMEIGRETLTPDAREYLTAYAARMESVATALRARQRPSGGE